MLTAGDFARSRRFYGELLPFLGMKAVIDGPGMYYCVGGRTALGVRDPSSGNEDGRFDQGRTGLHHLCFRARSREDVDRAHEFVQTIGTVVVHGPQDDDWAPGYYSILFEDPDGIRLEINHVPDKGLLD